VVTLQGSVYSALQKNLAASSPILFVCWLTNVKEGVIYSPNASLAKPTTAISSGIDLPAAFIDYIAPSAVNLQQQITHQDFF